MSTTFASIERRLGGGMMSALLIAALALPYARPMVCDVADHEASVVTHLNHEASVGSQVTDERPCDAIMDCCVIPVAPAADRPYQIAIDLHPAMDRSAPARTPLSTATSPLTPPPRI